MHCSFMGCSGTHIHVWGTFSRDKIEDTYFLTSLSKKCAPISLLRKRSGGEIVKDYITTYYRPRAHPAKDGNISIKYVTYLPLRMILFIIARLVVNSTLHFSSESYMQYGVECLQLTSFNSSEGFLVNMK